jgi:hypothetical protein
VELGGHDVELVGKNFVWVSNGPDVESVDVRSAAKGSKAARYAGERVRATDAVSAHWGGKRKTLLDNFCTVGSRRIGEHFILGTPDPSVDATSTVLKIIGRKIFATLNVDDVGHNSNL